MIDSISYSRKSKIISSDYFPFDQYNFNHICEKNDFKQE